MSTHLIDRNRNLSEAPPMGGQESQVSIRLSEELLGRVEDLLAHLEGQPGFSALGISRAGVIRMAIEAGVEVLEEQFGAA